MITTINEFSKIYELLDISEQERYDYFPNSKTINIESIFKNKYNLNNRQLYTKLFKKDYDFGNLRYFTLQDVDIKYLYPGQSGLFKEKVNFYVNNPSKTKIIYASKRWEEIKNAEEFAPAPELKAEFKLTDEEVDMIINGEYDIEALIHEFNEPCQAIKLNEHKYILFSGHHRIASEILLGKQYVKLYVRNI